MMSGNSLLSLEPVKYLAAQTPSVRQKFRFDHQIVAHHFSRKNKKELWSLSEIQTMYEGALVPPKQQFWKVLQRYSMEKGKGIKQYANFAWV